MGIQNRALKLRHGLAGQRGAGGNYDAMVETKTDAMPPGL